MKFGNPFFVFGGLFVCRSRAFSFERREKTLTQAGAGASIQCVKRDSRLSRVLHILLHLAQSEEPMTSELMAGTMNTNPVVIRRIMAGLRDAGFVRSEKGHGGGWSLACELSRVSLRDIYDALGEPAVLAISTETEAPGCLLEKAVNEALADTLEEARSLLLSRFDGITLAMLAESVDHRPGGRKGIACPNPADKKRSKSVSRNRRRA